MGYADREMFRSYLNVNRGTDVADDGRLQLALDAASELIDGYTSRSFVITDGTTSTRGYAVTAGPLLEIDDAVSISAVSDDTSVLVAGTDYLLVGAAPITAIRRLRGWRPGTWGDGWFDTSGRETVTVTGVWGWTAVPAAIVNACLILAKDIVSNQQVSFGIAAFTDYGIRARENPQVAMLLAPYSQRLGFA